MYRFEKSNPAAQSVHRGDVLVGEMTLTFEGDTIMSNAGNPQRLIQVGERAFVHHHQCIGEVSQKSSFADLD